MTDRSVQRAGVAAPHTRAVVVSWVVVAVIGVVIGVLVVQAFRLLGGDLASAALGVKLFLALSFVALLVGLLAIFDLVYLLGTHQHVVFQPLVPEEQRARPAWFQIAARFGPVVTVALGIVAGYTVFT
jgi:hypothetical protein